MTKLVLKDKSEIIIHDGTGMFNLVTDIKEYSELKELANKLTKENLSSVTIETDEAVIGVYTHLITTNPLFQIIKTKNNNIEVQFGLREMTEQELQYEQLSTEITNTEVALCEVYELIG